MNTFTDALRLESGTSTSFSPAMVTAAVAATAPGRQPRVAEFLAARPTRLSTAAAAAVTAARSGDAALRGEPRRFQALTAALWPVHRAVAIPAPRQPAAPAAQRARGSARPDRDATARFA